MDLHMDGTDSHLVLATYATDSEHDAPTIYEARSARVSDEIEDGGGGGGGGGFKLINLRAICFLLYKSLS